MIPGTKFGRLKAIKQDPEDPTGMRWICVCSCGGTRTEDAAYISDPLKNWLGCKSCEVHFQRRGG
jgi:hypothetical protein